MSGLRELHHEIIPLRLLHQCTHATSLCLRRWMRQHGGQLDVSSVPGEYTKFAITLPRSGPQLAGRGASK